jgi:SAM-dependent methyltransferase
MSTEVEPAVRRSAILTHAHRLFEIPAVFDSYQVLVDGGKRAPVARFLDGIDYESVIDLGCGTGAWSYLARGRYLGLDYSASFIQGCRRRFRDDPRKSFAVGDLESIDLEQSFDLALMLSVLHHLSEDQADALLRQLSGHAKRVLVMDLMPAEKNPLSRLLYKLDRGDYIRSADLQLDLLLRSGDWALERRDSFYSYNRLYRHTLFLLRSVATADPHHTPAL